MQPTTDPLLQELDTLFDPANDEKDDLHRSWIRSHLREIDRLNRVVADLKAELQGSCVHDASVICESRTTHFILRICAQCGLEEIHDEDPEFTVLVEAHRTVSWVTYDQIRHYDAATIRCLLDGNMPETAH